MTSQCGPQQEFRPQSVERVTEQLGSLKTGSGGQPIQLVTNHFQILTTNPDWSLYQYKVDFNPLQNRINNQRGLLSAHNDLLGAYIFDGTLLFSSKKYKPDTLELTSKQKYDNTVVIITITFISIIEKGDYEFIQILNSLLHRSLVNLNLTLVGRKFCDAEAKISIPKYKLQLWPGFETSIGNHDGGVFLKTEIYTKYIREETVLDFFKECKENEGKNSHWMVQFKMSVIGSEVLNRCDNQTYIINDVVEDYNTKSTFCKEDGYSTSYIDYYKQKYGINLSSYCQPILISQKNESFINGGDNSEPVYLVPELCSFTGITDAMKKNHYLVADLETQRRVHPSERIGRYKNLINRILTTPKSAESLKQWNLTLSNKLVTIPCHVLPQQSLQGKNYQFPAGNEANWTVHLCKLPMFTCAEIQRWVVLGPEENGAEVRQFTNTLLQVAKGMSFNLPQPEIVDLKDTSASTYSTTLDQVINQMDPSFILCVIPNSPSEHYNLIKRQLCLNRPVPSQIVLLKQMKNKNDMIMYAKISIKMNCKLGGAPWRVVIPEKSMMIVGFDVCHGKRNKSYGALIATMNDTYTSYFSCVQKYESRQELLNNFAMNIAKALNKYKSKNNTLPNSIIIYRDGMEDDQLSYVHQIEVDMLKKTCKEFYREKKVGLAFVIVKISNNTKFFCNNHNTYQNPPPGTVIDNTVTDPTMYDFYLISQNITNNAATPTHYNVIWDTLNETTASNFTPTIVQKLTYKLTHMSYNYSNTQMVPGPCQMARKLATFTAESLGGPANPHLEDLLYFM
ncbi:piwi-like protein Siwi [Acyrthosiphon pisum]|uniref:Uncharacterized protein n=1 Tax=Acyrthosiphon pisum TaxID=7029 RepID=A0A8R2A1Y7_ACYPI|nr:piwi-like protein Siwi [Acyrthosiphon pisum]|eukprot:XP_001947590.2 PREDICTED: protein piwi [Acyrthosiphon pisum]